MSDPRYRVVADTDRGDDPDIDRDYREGDRLVFENWDLGYEDERQIGTLVRIERPMPTHNVPDKPAAKPDADWHHWLQSVRADAWEEGYRLASGGMIHDPNPYK